MMHSCLEVAGHLLIQKKMYLSNLIIYMYTRVFITLYKYCRNFFVASTRSHNNFTKEHPQIASYNIISFEVTVFERETKRGEDRTNTWT